MACSEVKVIDNLSGCDRNSIGIEFEPGLKAGKVTKYSLEIYLSRGLIHMVQRICKLLLKK